ncbi:aminopeptidase N [Flavobacteriaceae bacterium MAR_2009_75]|nr:aminopeptidase N [Flavobacteriaceae bacterium MAR_2009_75]
MRNVFLLIFSSIFLLSYGQHQDKVDFLRADIEVELFPENEKVVGSINYEFMVLQDVDSVFLDAHNMVFEKVEIDNNKIIYNNSNRYITVHGKFLKGVNYQLSLSYSCQPEQTVYFLGWNDAIENNEQIWTQGQGKYTSHWLPSFDDMQEKVEFDMNITAHKDYKVVGNGLFKQKMKTSENKVRWSFDMQKPMSSYLLAFVVGNYSEQKLISKSGVPIINYYYPQDTLKAEPTYRYTKQIFDLFEEEIGVSYPWQNYKQIPVRDFLYAGMENTGTTIYSDGYVIDSTAFIDKNYVNINAHEMAHQWFGNLVTEKDGHHHWLHEGFATYYAYIAEKEIFGEEHFYWHLYKTLLDLKQAENRGEGQSVLNPKASSLTFYEKGAWALFALREHLGDAEFKAGIKNYLAKHAFKNVTVTDFLHEMKKASGKNLSEYKKRWLESSSIDTSKAYELLADKSKSLKILFDLQGKIKNGEITTEDYKWYWQNSNSTYLKRHLLEAYFNELPKKIIKEVFTSSDTKLRQVLSEKVEEIPLELKSDFESLLNDDSYITIENTLVKLWSAYPNERKKYLDATKNMVGLPNMNIRLLWLTLAIFTHDFEVEKTQEYFNELSGYTSASFSWEVRLKAFQYLTEAGFTDEALQNLILATEHHSWQFKKYARNLIESFLQNDEQKNRIHELYKELKLNDFRYMNIKLGIE